MNEKSTDCYLTHYIHHRPKLQLQNRLNNVHLLGLFDWIKNRDVCLIFEFIGSVIVYDMTKFEGVLLC